MESFFAFRSLAADLFSKIEMLSADTKGVSRPAFSEKETETLAYLESVARKHGLSTWQDNGKNTLFSLPEDKHAKKYVLVGSHVDSVPNGGNYDGLAGVISGLLALVHSQQGSKQFTHPVKVIALRGEESHWFGPCYIGSKCLTGKLSNKELSSRHKTDGQTLSRKLAALGVDTNPIKKNEPLMDLNELIGYIELHIEQGPMLVEKDIPAAIVSGIRGNLRHKKIVCHGEAGHSGAVPRVYRRDPVMAFVDLLSSLDESWLTIVQKGGDLVLTSGIVTTDPKTHSMSRISDQIAFSLDCRSQSTTVLNEMRALLELEMQRIKSERKVRFQLDEEIFTAPALMDERVITDLKISATRLGIEPFIMPSGGGHDAAVFANTGIPTGMIFVRNQNGSHNPDESMAIDDFLTGSAILFDYLTRTEK